ncbi:unnamed protein product [Arabis nemorensis]|uniref:Uncharacterized protein n=1 Tax=Arabis nemorensis TaxID=586526 RepID=A0A565CCM8_9BRAS|nr:unnamed protein product [Arabis nemorensis]
MPSLYLCLRSKVSTYFQPNVSPHLLHITSATTYDPVSNFLPIFGPTTTFIACANINAGPEVP